MKLRFCVLGILLSGLLAGHVLLGAGGDGLFPVTSKALALSGNYYAVAQESGGPWGGVHARWDIQYLYAPNWQSYGAALQDLWAVTNTAGDMEWIEVGYIHGWQWGQDATRFFWAEQMEGFPFTGYRITNPASGPVGTRHRFEIEQTGFGGGGQVIYKVYIDDICVEAWDDGNPVGCESWQNPGRWVVRMDVGAEAHHLDAEVGPTHATAMWHRAKDSPWWTDFTPNGHLVSDPSDSFWHHGAVYGMGVEFWDEFERPGPNEFPGWTLFREGGDIFIHYDGDQNPLTPWSHVHLDYRNPSSYLLLRRGPDDSATSGRHVVEFFFGDDLANPAGRFFAAWSRNDTYWLAVGVNTNRCPNDYFYFWAPWPNGACTGITRTSGPWHVFRIYVRQPSDGCSYAELDGQSLGAYCDLTPSNLATWGVASTWGLTDPPNSDGLWDKAAYFHFDRP